MERCTRCGGASHMRYERGGLSLYLCQRHAGTHGVALRERGWFAYLVAVRV